MGDTYKINVIKADTGEVVKTFEAVTQHLRHSHPPLPLVAERGSDG